MAGSGFGLLGRNAYYRRFLFARTASVLGNLVTVTALVLYLEETGASGTAVGILLLARTLPMAFSPLSGTVADRVDQRKLMLLCDFGQVLVVGSIALFLPPFPILVALVAVSSVFSTLFLPAGRSAVPALVRPEDLTPANALLASSFNFSFAAAPAFGGLLVAVSGFRAALLFDAATFLVSAAFLWRLPALPPAQVVGESAVSGVRKFAEEFREGLSYLLRHRVARAVGVGMFLSVAFAAMDNVALVFLTRDTLGAGEAGYGLALSAWGAGMVVAPLLLLRGRTQPRMGLVLLVGLGVMGTGQVLTGLAPFLGFALVMMALGGSGNGLENVATDTIIQKVVDRPMLGRVFGTVYGLIFLGESLAYALGGPLLELTSPRAVLIIAGVGVLLTLLLVSLLLGRSGISTR